MGKARKKDKKTMADQASTHRQPHDRLSPVSIFQIVQCLFCGALGRVVDHFPRRGYGRQLKIDGTGAET